MVCRPVYFTRTDLVAVEVLFSQEQTILWDNRILLYPNVTVSKTEERKAEKRTLCLFP